MPRTSSKAPEKQTVKIAKKIYQRKYRKQRSGNKK